jgi:hypothetical protein
MLLAHKGNLSLHFSHFCFKYVISNPCSRCKGGFLAQDLLPLCLPFMNLQMATRRQHAHAGVHESELDVKLRLTTCQQPGWSVHGRHDADLLCTRMAEDLSSWRETVVSAREDISRCVAMLLLLTSNLPYFQCIRLGKAAKFCVG